MVLNYDLAGEYADTVHALALVESNENPSVSGDLGKAYGLLQMHPATFSQYYGNLTHPFPPSLSDTWIDAEIKACGNFLTIHEAYELDLRIQAWNLGAQAAFMDGKRNPAYLARFSTALNKIHGLKK